MTNANCPQRLPARPPRQQYGDSVNELEIIVHSLTSAVVFGQASKSTSDVRINLSRKTLRGNGVMSPPGIRLITVRPNTENHRRGGSERIIALVENYPFQEGFIMTMLKKIAAVLVSLTAALLLTIGLAGTATAETTEVDPTTAPVTGTLADGTGAVTGTFDVQNIVEQNGTLQAVGTFTGTVTNAGGNSTQGTQQLSIPVDLAASAGSCQILDLVLGPLDLDLLGLQVHLDTVHLNITAQSGPGELVGNLLCAIANLLNGGLPLNTVLGQIAALLNQLLAILG